jgi:hypothetical protein
MKTGSRAQLTVSNALEKVLHQLPTTPDRCFPPAATATTTPQKVAA